MAAENARTVPDAVAPPPGNRRFPLLDGMRAIAVMAVVLVHVAFFAAVTGSGLPGDRLLFHLNIGVTIFFLISGFVLYRPFIAHRAGGPRAPAPPDYARRRFLRIVPAYWVLLTVLVLVPGLGGIAGGDWLSQYALLHTLPVSGSGDCIRENLTCGSAQTWSLVVEATFYAVLPLYALLAERLVRGLERDRWMRLELLLLAALSAVSLALHFWLTDGDMPGFVAGTFLGYVLWFSLGMGMAVVSVALEGREAHTRAVAPIRRHPLLIWLAAASLYVILCFQLQPSPFLFDMSDRFLAHVGFGVVALLLILPAVFGEGGGGLPRRFLANRVVAWVGLVSYGIFLWHYVVVLELTEGDDPLGFWPLLAATVAITLACATLSYYLVERPLLRFKDRRSPARRRTAAAS